MKKEDLDSYKKKQIKTLKLPSGLEIKVRNISPYTLLKIHEDLDINPDDGEIHTVKVIEKLFEEFLIEPKIPKDIILKDFEREDYIYLHELIFDKVSFPEEEEEVK